MLPLQRRRSGAWAVSLMIVLGCGRNGDDATRAGHQPRASVTAWPGLLVATEGTVKALYFDPRAEITVTHVSLKPEEYIFNPVMSAAGRYLCIQVGEKIPHGPDSRLLLLERRGDAWEVAHETGRSPFCGVPMFVCADKYLLYARYPDGYVDERRYYRVECELWDIREGRPAEHRIAPIHAWDRSTPVGSPLDEARFLLTKWISPEQSSIVIYDVVQDRCDVLRAGFYPLKLDEREFVFMEHGATWIAPFRDAANARRLLGKAAPQCVVPGTREVLVDVSLSDSWWSGEASGTLWCLSADIDGREYLSKKDRKLLNQDDFVKYATGGCFSWYASNPAK